MCCIVTSVPVLVHFYSTENVFYDSHLHKFMLMSWLFLTQEYSRFLQALKMLT